LVRISNFYEIKQENSQNDRVLVNKQLTQYVVEPMLLLFSVSSLSFRIFEAPSKAFEVLIEMTYFLKIILEIEKKRDKYLLGFNTITMIYVEY